MCRGGRLLAELGGGPGPSVALGDVGRDTPGGCNYHLYAVLREFRVEGGPIAPAFGQRGYGLQYLLVASMVPGAPAQLNVMWLVANGYLQRLI